MTGSLQISKGKYYAVLNLKDENGKRKQKYVNLHIEAKPGYKRKAEQAYRALLVEYEKNQISMVRRDVLFCDYLKEWLEVKRKTIEVNTYEGYQEYINVHIYPFFKKLNVTLEGLNYKHLQRYYDEKGKKLSANSLRRHHTIINQTLKMALKHDLISNNPASKVTLPKIEKFTGKFLSVEEGNILLEVSTGTPMETVIILAMMYGLRRSEIAGLKWSAIDLINDTLEVRHTVVKYKTIVAKDKTKNQSSNRTLVLNGMLKAYLLKLRTQQARERLLLGSAYHDTDYVCRWSDGRVMACNYCTNALRKLLAKHNLPKVRLHDLRHSCASFMLKMGCSMKEIQDWLGHRDIGTTMNIYAHLDTEAKKAVASKFEKMLTINV